MGISNPTLLYVAVQTSKLYIKTNSTYLSIWVLHYLEPGAGLGVYSIKK